MPLSVYGSPSEAGSGIKNCPKCYDQRAPQSYLSIVAANWGADPQTLIQPRPQQYFKTYALSLTLPGSRYNAADQAGLSLAPGFTGDLIVNGVISGNGASAAFSNALLTVNSFALTSVPSLSQTNISIDISTPPATYLFQVTQAGGYVLTAALAVS